MMNEIHPIERRLIDRHFAERSTPDREVVLRNHLATCASCQAYYDRHALLAKLDPQAPAAVERLASGFGFRSRASVKRARWTALVLAPAAALLLYAWLPGRSLAPGGPFGAASDDFAARGGPAMAAGPTLHAFRVSADAVLPVAGTMSVGDELAFAYENPAGFERLMVVAVDEGGRVFWYHPDPEASALAVSITQQAGRHELPVAIRHEHAPGPLRLLGLFSREPLSVATVRPLLGPAGCSPLRAGLPALTCVEMIVNVTVQGGQGP